MLYTTGHARHARLANLHAAPLAQQTRNSCSTRTSANCLSCSPSTPCTTPTRCYYRKFLGLAGESGNVLKCPPESRLGDHPRWPRSPGRLPRRLYPRACARACVHTYPRVHACKRAGEIGRRADHVSAGRPRESRGLSLFSCSPMVCG